jgi:hypothetical protein
LFVRYSHGENWSVNKVKALGCIECQASSISVA